jgi:hypothetical protein
MVKLCGEFVTEIDGGPFKARRPAKVTKHHAKLA